MTDYKLICVLEWLSGIEDIQMLVQSRLRKGQPNLRLPYKRWTYEEFIEGCLAAIKKQNDNSSK